MRRATFGSWCSYSTTLVFQVAFATKFGATGGASAFVLVFAAVISLSGVYASAGQTLVVPRLSAGVGQFSRQAIALWIRLAGLMGLTALLLFALVGWLGSEIAAHIDVSPDVARDLLKFGLLVGCLQFVAIGLASMSLTMGARFAPAAAPTLPTFAAALWLVAVPGAGIPSVMGALALGSAMQCGVLGFLVLRRRFAIVYAPFEGLGSMGLLTILNLAALSLLPPLERLLAATAESAGAAHFDYAMRSLLAAQQLIVAGAVLASLGDWSTDRFAKGPGFAGSVYLRLSIVAVLLIFAALVALGAAPLLVGAVYERGEFGSEDTQRVAELLRIALPSFVAGGISLLLSQAFVAARRNRELILLGLTRFGLRVFFATIMVRQWGIAGLVAGISLADTLVFVLQFSLWRSIIRQIQLPLEAAS